MRTLIPARFNFFVLCSLLTAAVVGIFSIHTRSVYAVTMSPVRAELAANPGQEILSKFIITNEELGTNTFYLLAQNFNAKDESGTPVFSPKKDGLASWMHLPETLTLGPREQRVVEYSVAIPPDTEPGGYFTGIFASSAPPTEKEDGTIAIGSQVGTLVLLRVNGTITEGVDILEFKTKDRKLFSSLPVDFYFRFQNSGESWVKPIGDLIIKNTTGTTSKVIAANPDGSNVLPKSIRRFDVSWLTNTGKDVQDKHAERPPEAPLGYWNKVKYQWKYFALGRYTANLSLTYNNDSSTTKRAHASFWVVPWHFLSIAIPAGLFALYLLRFAIKRYNRYIIRRSQKPTKKPPTKKSPA